MNVNTCPSCDGAILPIAGDELLSLASRISSKWRLIDEHHLECDFETQDFKSALAQANRIGAVAEELGHHPDLHVAWGNLRVTIWTHKVNGLTEADFVLAGRIDELAKDVPRGEPA